MKKKPAWLKRAESGVKRTLGAVSERSNHAKEIAVKTAKEIDEKLQGQEAPIVIYSMTSSSPEDAPRGMEFLYNPNRFNVATSRARALCILVENPALFEPNCKTPGQMKMANGFCRYRELAKIVEL